MTETRLAPLTLALLVTLVAAARPARADDFVEDTQLWAPTVLQVVVVPERVRAYLEVQPRLFDDAGRLGLVLYRPAVSFQIARGLTLWGGYAYAERHFPGRYAGCTAAGARSSSCTASARGGRP